MGRSLLAACNICFLKTVNHIEVQKLFCFVLFLNLFISLNIFINTINHVNHILGLLLEKGIEVQKYLFGINGLR